MRTINSNPNSAQEYPLRAQAAIHTHEVYDRLLSGLQSREARSTTAIDDVLFTNEDRLHLRSEGASEYEVDLIEEGWHRIFYGRSGFETVYQAPQELFARLKESGREYLTLRHRIVAVPGIVLNALMCEKLVRLFGRERVLSVPGFVGYFNGVRIDLDTSLARRGFLVPILKCGLITNLRVYRSPSDRKPFLLKSRVKGGGYDIR